MKLSSWLIALAFGSLILPSCSQNSPAPSQTGAPSAVQAQPTAQPSPVAIRKVGPETLKKIESEFVPIPGGVLPGNFRGDFVVGHEGHANQAVTVGPFLLARHEVTLGEWSEVISSSRSVTAEEADLPVSNVSWLDAQEFIARLNEAAGSPIFRLPSAAEWAYACRAGAHAGPFQDPTEASVNERAWWGKNSDGRVHPVARRKPNAWGLFDMWGNVEEWCSDESERKEGYSMRPTAGGHFENEDVSTFRCGVNGTLADNAREPYMGFRLARSYRPGEKAAKGPSQKKRAAPPKEKS